MDALLSALVPPWMSPAQAVATYSMILLLTLFLFGTLYMLFLMLRYPNRGLFTRSEKERPDLPLVPGAPLLGNLPFLASVQSYLVEAQWDLVKEYKKAYRMTVGAPVPSFMTFNGRAVSGEWIVITTVEDLEMVLKDPVSVFETGLGYHEGVGLHLLLARFVSRIPFPIRVVVRKVERLKLRGLTLNPGCNAQHPT